MQNLRKRIEQLAHAKGITDTELINRVHNSIKRVCKEEKTECTDKDINQVFDEVIRICTFKNPEFRELDGYYFRVKRDDEWQNICWSDLTEEEMREVLKGRSQEWLESLCIGLGQIIRNIGDTFNITGRLEEDEE